VPPAWVDFSWAVVQEERYNVKLISVIITSRETWVLLDEMAKMQQSEILSLDSGTTVSNKC
jgi:hypothetical protein